MQKDWTITFDPLKLVDSAGDYSLIEASAQEEGEDIIQAQAENGTNRTLDLGWYVDRYCVMLIENSDWDRPLEKRESKTLKQAMADFRSLLQ